MKRDVLYRCRLCGAKFAGDSTPYGRHALNTVILDRTINLDSSTVGGPVRIVEQLSRFDLHDCEDGSIGLAHLVGLGKEPP